MHGDESGGVTATHHNLRDRSLGRSGLVITTTNGRNHDGPVLRIIPNPAARPGMAAN